CASSSDSSRWRSALTSAPAPAPMAAPTREVISAPAPMNGPTPGITNEPIPTSQPAAAPSTPPATIGSPASELTPVRGAGSVGAVQPALLPHWGQAATLAPGNRPQEAAMAQRNVDVVVVGGGGAGLAAAVTARELGASVLVLEEQPAAGGKTALAMGSLTASE